MAEKILSHKQAGLEIRGILWMLDWFESLSVNGVSFSCGKEGNIMLLELGQDF
ncbi:MAG: hypothetical protein O8C66_04345 [Candidatus Methanoperedens sp.]|nr:hypothetical protein [Candidatus Methanoperedens sp.]MCZ7369718.1 hypothetical protein [Candidatus Methanoperedens sp.]